MSEHKPEDDEDSWLSLAEIGEELRVNPATVRLWISNGELTAMRAGRRKLLVRRSELQRMLRERENPSPPTASQLRPVFRSSRAGTVARAQAMMDPAAMREAIMGMQESEGEWDAAVEASNNAPPDPGFAGRIRAVAAASTQRAESLMRADRITGFLWKPQPEAPEILRSHELRRGANRPGPAALWRRFDMTIERLSIAVQGNVFSLVADEFHEIASVLEEIADALDGEESGAE